jgi:tRNA pseudouridine32 synthase / 23S rRNA pseudouridine746 synthase
MEPRIVFEDEQVLAADKPSGQPAIPGRGDIGEPLNLALERAGKGKLLVVHRLDRDASGVMVFAKTAAAHARLCAQFEARRAHKAYLALVDGVVERAGVVDRPLREFGSGRVGISAEGKPSLTRYDVRGAGRRCTLLSVAPESGRRHQIRAHLYSIGHPILGDRLYGEPRPVGGAARLMLHAWKLELEGLPPLECAPGEDFLSLLRERGASL